MNQTELTEKETNIAQMHGLFEANKIKAEIHEFGNMYLYADRKIESEVLDAIEKAGYRVREAEVDLDDYSSRTNRIQIRLRLFVSRKYAGEL